MILDTCGYVLGDGMLLVELLLMVDYDDGFGLCDELVVAVNVEVTVDALEVRGHVQPIG